MTSIARKLLVTTAVLALTFISALGNSAAASAQAAVTGSADFRNAPQLPEGTFSDRLVTGDSAWYSLVYTNRTPYEISVSIAGGATPSGVSVFANFVDPTLETADGPNAVLSGKGLSYPSGHTNVWFLQITLESTGQSGVEFPILIEVSGVQDEGTESCRTLPGCTLDQDLAALDREIAAAEIEVGGLPQLQTNAAVRSEIENLNGFIASADTLGPAARDRLGRAEAQMARLCAPEPTCETFPDPGSNPSPIGLAVGGLVLIFGARRALKALRAGEEDREEELDKSTAPSPARTR